MTVRTTAAAEVEPGELVILPNGQQLLVSRVDQEHLGTSRYVKLVEDTDERWICYALPRDAQLEVIEAPARIS